MVLISFLAILQVSLKPENTLLQAKLARSGAQSNASVLADGTEYETPTEHFTAQSNTQEPQSRLPTVCSDADPALTAADSATSDNTLLRVSEILLQAAVIGDFW